MLGVRAIAENPKGIAGGTGNLACAACSFICTGRIAGATGGQVGVRRWGCTRGVGNKLQGHARIPDP